MSLEQSITCMSCRMLDVVSPCRSCEDCGPLASCPCGALQLTEVWECVCATELPACEGREPPAEMNWANHLYQLARGPNPSQNHPGTSTTDSAVRPSLHVGIQMPYPPGEWEGLHIPRDFGLRILNERSGRVRFVVNSSRLFTNVCVYWMNTRRFSQCDSGT